MPYDHALETCSRSLQDTYGATSHMVKIRRECKKMLPSLNRKKIERALRP